MLVPRSFEIAILGSVLSLAGCVHGDYRVVKTTPNAGEVALSGPQQEAHTKAEGYMASRCAKGYDILEEGEVVVGSTSTAQTRNQATLFGPAQNTNTSTTDKREWRIKYQCKGGDSSTAPAAPAAPQGMIHEVYVTF